MPLERSESEILFAHTEQIKQGIKKCIPATVTAVHPDRQTVDVQVAIINVVHDELGNTFQEPVIGMSDVPLGVMRGGGMFVWLPVAVGDSVLLICSDLSCDTWRAGDGNPQPPGFTGRHTYDSPFAIPCCAPDGKFFTSPNADPNKIIIGPDRDTAQIHIGPSDIELGHPAADKVALASKVDNNFATILTSLEQLTVYVNGLAPGTVTPITPPLPPTGSSLVKCG